MSKRRRITPPPEVPAPRKSPAPRKVPEASTLRKSPASAAAPVARQVDFQISTPTLVGAAAVVAAMATMIVLTWRCWPDPLVDFGRELYVPWQLTQGKVLYRDLFYLNGPFSPYLNAVVFKWLGVSLLAVVMANLLILGGIVLLLSILLRRVSGRLGVTVALVFFGLVFACAQFTDNSNYNYLTPYSHEMTHGLLLSLGALVCLGMWSSRGRWGWATGGGALLGLAFLTKPEIFLAVSAGAAAEMLYPARLNLGWRRAVRGSLAVLGVGAAVVALAAGLLALAMPWREALRGVVGGWPAALDSSVRNMEAYRIWMGVDKPGANLRIIALATGGYLLILAGAVGLDRWAGSRRRALPLAIALGVVVTVAMQLSLVGWMIDYAYRPLPLLLFVLAAAFAWHARRGSASSLAVRALPLVVFSLVLLYKRLLTANVAHYGFVLVMPAAVLGVVVLMDWLPGAMARRGGSGWLIRAVVLGLMGPWVFYQIDLIMVFCHTKPITVSAKGDRFSATPEGASINAVLNYLAEHANPDDTLVVVPEGAMINYLLEMANPTPYISFMPLEMHMAGDAKVAAALAAHPPTYVLNTEQGVAEYGLGNFGVGYGRQTAQFIHDNYVIVPVRFVMPSYTRWRLTLMRYAPETGPAESSQTANGPIR